MDMQQIQVIFMTEVMPLIAQGMGMGFNCQWKNQLVAMGEKKLAEYLSKFGMDMLTNGVVAVADWIMVQIGLKQDCDAIHENALF